MKAGTLKHRIHIEQRLETQNSLGEMEYQWQAVQAVWANMRFLSGKEFSTKGQDAAGGVQLAKTTVSIRIRYRTDLNETMRVRHGNDIYNIHAILPDNNRVYLDLACEKGANHG